MSFSSDRVVGHSTVKSLWNKSGKKVSLKSFAKSLVVSSDSAEDKATALSWFKGKGPQKKVLKLKIKKSRKEKK